MQLSILENTYDFCYPKPYIEKAGFIQSLVLNIAKKVEDFSLSPSVQVEQYE